MPSPEFFQDYRHSLAVQLFSTPDRQVRHQILTKAQSTLDYQLAKGERQAKQNKVDFESIPLHQQKQYQENTPDKFNYFMSNENNLYQIFSTIKEKTGTIIAVGPDQGLDIFANSQTQYLFMVDISRTTSLFTRALLEIGSTHKKIFGQYPTTDQYQEYFQPENIHHIGRFLKDNFKESEINEVLKRLRINPSNGSTQYYRYLDYKRHLTGDNGQTFSWNSSNQNLQRIFEAYDQNRIFVIQSDIGSQTTIEKISEFTKKHESNINILYLSNLVDYRTGQALYFTLLNLTKLPISEQNVFITASSDLNFKYPKTNQNINDTLRDWQYFIMSSSQFKLKLESEKNLAKSQTWLFEPCIQNRKTIPINSNPVII